MLTQRLLLSDRGGMIVLGLIALTAVIVPILNLAVPHDSIFHVSTYTVTLLGRFNLGLCRHPVAGARCVLCVGWLRHGHVPDATNR